MRTRPGKAGVFELRTGLEVVYEEGIHEYADGDSQHEISTKKYTSRALARLPGLQYVAERAGTVDELADYQGLARDIINFAEGVFERADETLYPPDREEVRGYHARLAQELVGVHDAANDDMIREIIKQSANGLL
ncbi:hypothetical protein LTR22_000087 [Elasticomyces elasticus]|nr:hypothetical protein LTR22_000087 [Elasticomyces elasticus]